MSLTISVKQTETGKKHSAAAKKVKEYLQKIWDEKIDLPGEWRIVLSFGSIPDEALATTVCEWQYKMAYIKFDLVRHGARGGGDQILFESCVHELLHIPVWIYGQVATSMIQTEEGRALLADFEEHLVHTFECMPAFRFSTPVEEPKKKENTK